MIAERLFGIDFDSIDKSNIENLIGTPENYGIEFKTIQSDNKEKNEESVLKSVVGFLNSDMDDGLIILGVETEEELANKIIGVNKDDLKEMTENEDTIKIVKEIVGVDRKALKKKKLKSEVYLEQFIKGKVECIPPYLKNQFGINTKIVEWEDDKVVPIIEVKNTKWDRLYYSGASNLAYIRHGKSTHKIDLINVIDLVSKKSFPQVYLNIGQGGCSISSGVVTSFNHIITYINEGVKPSNGVNSKIFIGYLDKKDGRNGSMNITQMDIQKHDLKKLGNYDEVRTFRFFYPHPQHRMKGTNHLYPFIKYRAPGHITILKDDYNKIKHIIALTFDDSGFSRQEFVVSRKEGEISKNQNPFYIEETKRDFTPYLSL